MNDSLFCHLMEYTNCDYNNIIVSDDILFLYWEHNHFHYFKKKNTALCQLTSTLKTKY